MDPVRLTRETYERIAGAYAARNATPHPDFVAFRAAFADAVGEGPVADLGCGPGDSSAALADAGLVPVGVDITTAMLERTASKGVPVVRGDLRRPPLRDGAWAGLWSCASLLHVPRPEVDATLRRWHALLRPGGVLGLSTSVGDDEGWEVVPYAAADDDGIERSRWFVHHEEQDLVARLEAAGFTVTWRGRRTSHRDWLMLLATSSHVKGTHAQA